MDSPHAHHATPPYRPPLIAESTGADKKWRPLAAILELPGTALPRDRSRRAYSPTSFKRLAC